MLQTPVRMPIGANFTEPPQLTSLHDAISAARRIVRQQIRLILACILLCVGLGVGYLYITPPLYDGSATLLIDPRRSTIGQQQAANQGGADLAVDTGAVETQIQILKSDDIALTVIRQLDLTHDPDLTTPGPIGSLIAKISSIGGRVVAPSPEALEKSVAQTFAKRLSITRQGISYVIDIDFRSRNKQKAAIVANAVAEAYIRDQLDSKFEVTRRAGDWLQARLAEIRSQTDSAEHAVVEFKQKNDIVDSGGRLINDQQLAEINTELVTAAANTSEAKARLDRIQNVMTQGIPDASVADALKNDVIVSNRQKYLDLAQREGIIASKYGHDHLAAVALQKQMEQLRLNITDEMRKIAESYRSDYEIAKTREESLRKSLNSAVSASQRTSQSQAELHALESRAETYRTIYESFLQRSMEAAQQESFPITEARLIGRATPPLSQSSPVPVLVLGGSLFAGLLLGFGLAAMREASDRVFRAGTMVQSALRVQNSVLVPAVKHRELRKLAGRSTNLISNSSLDAYGRGGVLSYALDAPLSRFAEAIRMLKVMADLHGIPKSTRVIGVTSTYPTEGKTTIAANIALLIASGGRRVALVDGDLRNPSLSEYFHKTGLPGVVEIVSGEVALSVILAEAENSPFLVLPAGQVKNVAHSNEIIGSDAMADLIAGLRATFDYVILDLPPLAPVVDVRVASQLVDGFYYVVEWAKTKSARVERNLASAPEIYDKLLAVVLNKSDLQAVANYEEELPYYDRPYYVNYGAVE